MNERIKLSSDFQTVSYGIITPVLLFGGVLLTSIFALAVSYGFFFMSLVLTAMGVVYLLFGTHYNVSVDSDRLFVSNRTHEIEIPLGEIASIEIKRYRTTKVVIYLNHPCEFGSEIKFIPAQRWFESVREGHPTVDVLEKIRRGKQREAGSLNDDKFRS